MRTLPIWLRNSVYSRLFSSRHKEFNELFQEATLGCLPEIKMNLLPGDHISGYIAFTGYYEHTLTKRVLTVARSGGLMIDIGANLGYFSLIWAKANLNNHVIAVEASPRNISFLKKNVDTNKLRDRIDIKTVGAGRENGKLQFDIGPQEQSGWGGFTNDPEAASIVVDVVRIDEIVPLNTRVRLLKIDIEGADTWALQGCEKLLQEKLIDEIWFEQNKPRMKKLGIGQEESTDFLAALGYVVKPMSDTCQDLVDWCAVPK